MRVRELKPDMSHMSVLRSNRTRSANHLHDEPWSNIAMFIRVLRAAYSIFLRAFFIERALQLSNWFSYLYYPYVGGSLP